MFILGLLNVKTRLHITKGSSVILIIAWRQQNSLDKLKLEEDRRKETTVTTQPLNDQVKALTGLRLTTILRKAEEWYKRTSLLDPFHIFKTSLTAVKNAQKKKKIIMK